MGFILWLDLFSCSLGCAFPHDKGVGRPVNLCHKHIPSGWYWGWSKKLIGTSSNSYRVLCGGMYTVLLYPILPYWPCMPHLSKSLSSHWCGCVRHSSVGRELEPSLIHRDCLSNCGPRTGSVLVALCPRIDTEQMIVALLRSWKVLFSLAFHTTDLCVVQSGYFALHCCIMMFPERPDICLFFKPQNSNTKWESYWSITDWSARKKNSSKQVKVVM